MKKKVLTAIIGMAIICSIAGITMAAWDDTKSTGDTLTADEWNAMVADQKSRLPKDGSEPMTGDLDMNGNDINNVYWISSKSGLNLLLANKDSPCASIKIAPSEVVIDADTLPYEDDAQKLGSVSYRWSDIYTVNTRCDNIYAISNSIVNVSSDLNMTGHVINGTDAIKSLPSASLYLWAHGTTQLSCGNGHVTIYGDIYPNGDDQYKCGDSTARWSDIYANNTHWGDLGFTETSYNNRPFKVGDTLVLKVKRFDNETGDTMCIPIPINETPEYKALEQRVEMLEERLEALEGDRR